MMALAQMEQSLADRELARAAGRGDRAAFAALVERHYDFIYRVSWRLTGSRTEAEDIAQDVCARLGVAIRTYRADSAFTTWLYAIITNAVRDAGRKRVREGEKISAWARDLSITDTGPGDGPAEALWAAVRGLPAKQQEAVTLVYGEGLSHARAAEIMAVSETTVSWHIHEAKKRLKQIVSVGDA